MSKWRNQRAEVEKFLQKMFRTANLIARRASRRLGGKPPDVDLAPLAECLDSTPVAILVPGWKTTPDHTFLEPIKAILEDRGIHCITYQYLGPHEEQPSPDDMFLQSNYELLGRVMEIYVRSRPNASKIFLVAHSVGGMVVKHSVCTIPDLHHSPERMQCVAAFEAVLRLDPDDLPDIGGGYVYFPENYQGETSEFCQKSGVKLSVWGDDHKDFEFPTILCQLKDLGCEPCHEELVPGANHRNIADQEESKNLMRGLLGFHGFYAS